MKLKIKNIVLYPKDKSKDKRIISFELEKVNVITGESHKGKSALVHVIDYCLGSEKCSIPVGYIRDLTDWFGVHVIAEKTELLILRKEPGDKISTDKMIMVESSEPIDIDKITNAENHQANREQVINRLNQLSGLSTERIDLDNPRNGFGGSASFRDTSAFQFQPQHIVANPYALFYKADTYEHQQKLKSIFPLLIGAITNEALNIEREIKELEVSFKKLQSELATKKQAVESWKNDLKAHFNRAIQLGLLKSIPDASQNFDAEQYLFYLNLVISDFNASPIPVYQTGTSEKDVQLQLDLNSLERTLQSEIASRKIRLTKLQSLNASTTQYKETVVTHQKRLEPVSWFKEKINHEYCPFCESKNEAAQKQIESLDVYNRALESISQTINTKDINLDREIADIRSEIRDLETKLNENRDILREIYNKSAEENNERQTIEELYKFIGRLEQALENVSLTKMDSTLDLRIKELQEQIDEKNEKLQEIKSRHSLKNILSRISVLISHYVSLLDIDRKNDGVELDIVNLTLKIASPTSSRSDYLWEVGSGANWMGYHLSVMFALHEHFLSLKHNFVPSFLLIDQPSQVYFPKDVPQAEEIRTFSELASTNDDFNQTRKIFEVASDCIARTKGKFQIIIVEHAPEITWQGVSNIHLVDEWRNDKALIPKDWIVS
jgi:predicted  nucleic acid-binding Zn-ribbon protein